MAIPTDEHIVCRDCGRVLDWYEDPLGIGGWRHTLMDGGAFADHPPQPVPDNEVEAIYRCDFCSADESVWTLPVASFTLPGLVSDNFTSDGDWSACQGCGSLIERNQWNALLRRVKAAHLKRHGEPMPEPICQALARMYQQVRKNVKGGLRPFVRPLAANQEAPEVQDGQRRASGAEEV